MRADNSLRSHMNIGTPLRRHRLLRGGFCVLQIDVGRNIAYCTTAFAHAAEGELNPAAAMSVAYEVTRTVAMPNGVNTHSGTLNSGPTAKCRHYQERDAQNSTAPVLPCSYWFVQTKVTK